MTESERTVYERVHNRHSLEMWQADRTDAVAFMTLEALGLDPVDIMLVVLDCEDAFNIDLSVAVITDALTIASLAAECDRRKEAAPQ